jgi:hypothetical protein
MEDDTMAHERSLVLELSTNVGKIDGTLNVSGMLTKPFK